MLRRDTKECYNSNLLAALTEEDFALLSGELEHEQRHEGEILYRPGDNVAKVYFPCGASLVSYLVTGDDGRDVETILVGREGAVGGIVSSGFLPAYSTIVVKFAGPYVTAPINAVERAKLTSQSFRRLFSRYADCLMAQMFQSIACNAIHSIEQRTAKWILSAMDRTGEDVIPLTQEQLASMLGVGRSYTSRVIQSFKARGIVETRRGALKVRDRDLLQSCSCNCNASVKEHFETVLRGVYPETQNE